MTVAVLEKPHDGSVDNAVDNVGKWCLAKTRPGAKYPACHQAAGWGTDHPGKGRCKLHGGKAPRLHGRYSTVTSTSLQQLIEEHSKDPEPLSMFPELHTLRALTVDYLNRYQENTAAVWAWYEDWRAREDGKEGPMRPKPRQVLDIASAAGLLTDITRVVERIENVRAQNAISRKELHRLVDAMGAVVEREVKDEDVVNRIRDGWLTIRPS
jgi:hypothetical protein